MVCNLCRFRDLWLLLNTCEKIMEHYGHKAWRYLGRNVAYVESIDHPQGDPYSYTSDVNKAALITEQQCREFCEYMKRCETIGFWS